MSDVRCQEDVSVTGRSFVQESYRMCVGVSLNVIRCNSNPPHLTMSKAGRGQTKKGRKELCRSEGMFLPLLGPVFIFP